MQKTLTGIRIVNKHALETAWAASSFIPKQGELIVYDVDDTYTYERFKIGDGVHNVNELPFSVVQSDWNQSSSNQLTYIQNRTHYLDASWTDDFSKEVEIPELNTTYQLWDFSHGVELAYLQQNFKYEIVRTPTYQHLISVWLKLEIYNAVESMFMSEGWRDVSPDASDKGYDFTEDLTLLDTVNYSVSAYKGMATFYVILDTSTLTGENIDKFQTPGVYVTTANEMFTKARASFLHVVQIEDRYIPESIARTSELSKKDERYIIHLDYSRDDADQPVFTLNNFNYDDVVTAINSNKSIICRINKVRSGSTDYYECSLFRYNSEDGELLFSFDDYGNIEIELLCIASDGSVTTSSDTWDYLRNVNRNVSNLAGELSDVSDELRNVSDEVSSLTDVVETKTTDYYINAEEYYNDDSSEAVYELHNFDWDKTVSAILNRHRVVLRIFEDGISVTNLEYVRFFEEDMYITFGGTSESTRFEATVGNLSGESYIHVDRYELNTDNQLTTSGQAADAKVVGDKLALKADISSIPVNLSDLQNDTNYASIQLITWEDDD